MLQPVRTKWRKAHKGRIHGYASRANFINYGAFALKAMTPERVTGKQIEAARVAVNPADLVRNIVIKSKTRPPISPIPMSKGFGIFHLMAAVAKQRVKRIPVLFTVPSKVIF